MHVSTLSLTYTIKKNKSCNKAFSLKTTTAKQVNKNEIKKNNPQLIQKKLKTKLLGIPKEGTNTKIRTKRTERYRNSINGDHL